MCKNAPTSDPETQERFAAATELFSLVHRMSCACAAHPRHVDAPLSRDLFRRIEDQGQSLTEAAKVLGLGPKDCVYLLAGFRRDLAVELVALLVAAEIPRSVVEKGSRDLEVRNEGH
ncbi:MAG TPA: hypothetical protein VIN05_05430 [Roseovarius sp.]|uniref:hypothetical protein n=1 Tax=Roseovarius sp. M141 TaxID=2583806 RepID=UPI0020CC7E2E|nr:hypothetical protein [Roseovarius sp. M141]MCQ0090405.1 hypothetical protein [Roseovarius sp. M141]